jgi:hypothetical protein
MTAKDITRYRLHFQQLAKPIFDQPEQVVSWMGAVQAQDYFGGLWSVGQRMEKATETRVEKALIERKIIRTWPMRGTLHFVAPADARWMLKYLTPRIISRSAGLYNQAGLDNKVFAKSKKLLIKALEGGHQLTRDEIYELLERAKIATSNSRGLHILGHLAQEGLICFGTRKGKQQTFTLMDEWIPAFPMLGKEEAFAELALRYFTSHGPALVDDFMWWTGLTKKDAQTAIMSVGEKLTKEMIDGKAYWFPAVGDPGKINAGTAYLLPTYDEYGIAYKNRGEIITPADHKQLGSSFISGIAINGRVVGSWRRILTKEKVRIEVKTFGGFTKAQSAAIVSAGKRYGNFLGLPVETNFLKKT